MQKYLNQTQIKQIFQIAEKCSFIAKKNFLNKNFQIFVKDDGSKVTSIDLEISDLIGKELTSIFPNIPIICEEKKLRDAKNTFFLIDPIDGTSSLIKNSEEFCINIALIINKFPVFGIIYAPIFENGKFIFNDGNEVFIGKNSNFENALPIKSKQQKNFDSLKIITSPRTKMDLISNFCSQHFSSSKIQQIENLSSALKFFRIAEGDANLYIHPKRSMEWDTASGHAIVNALGYEVNNFKIIDDKIIIESELTYQKNNFENSGFIIF
ncbi:MAG: 3'(2'),5'-bisphosphate nucleotidase CysQ [Alphaproteobacteria bacterium]